LWRTESLHAFISLLARYHSRFPYVSLFTSHTHMDDLRQIKLPDGTKLYAYATPSISRIHHNHASFKQFELNTKLELEDYTTFYSQTDTPWEEKNYSAINGPEHVFQGCEGQALTHCLDSLSEEASCNALQQGAYYGSKSTEVDGSVCRFTYPVN
jgi:alkaline phosphatase D